MSSCLRKSVLSRGPRRLAGGMCKECSPIKWTKYFEKEQDVYVNNCTFHVYLAGASGPLLLLIHGGGYSSLTWSLFTDEITKKIECQVLAIDLRGHGNTRTDRDEDLSLNTLAQDIKDVVDTYFEGSIPPVVIIGHSLGGAIAVSAASLIDNVVGLCVIDVVEGTALESLSSMQSILRSRPSSFKTIEQAIQWSYRGGQTHNIEAARVSMPGQIINIETGNLAANECDKLELMTNNFSENKITTSLLNDHSSDIIEEEGNECNYENVQKTTNSVGSHKIPISGEMLNVKQCDNKLPPYDNTFKVPIVEKNVYVWRIDLSKTEQFWNGWFKGLSQKFLDLSVPKVLLLANIHGLDTALTVGQMQGKFQLQVLSKSGHAVHEDQPHNVADIIGGFLVKQKLAVPRSGFTPSMPAC